MAQIDDGVQNATSHGAVADIGVGPIVRDVAGNILQTTRGTERPDGSNKWAFTILAIAFGVFAAGLLVAGSLMAGVGHTPSASSSWSSDLAASGISPSGTSPSGTSPSGTPWSGSSGLHVRFADPAWNGVTIPDHARCSRYGPAGASPELIVTGLPEGTRMIAVAFNDDSYRPLATDGGHGMIAIAAEGDTGWAVVPAVPGETTALPKGVTMIAPHRGRLSPGTAYLGPCSGGTGNHYSAEILALRTPLPLPGMRLAVTKGDMLGRSVISLGRY
ncbi:hypothetical protein [uncultured Tistrella sp.]|uniref:hypothetical protein n=1 Tax=Tistrella mobilis TaxID=171437 RepID=UPI000C09B266|nr:hypothetical protein [uncultured Tistrella sp.]MAM73453.1 hypothetical protein [Tistrella sp.]